MSEERPPAITDADIRALAAKLKGLYALLTPSEQEVLHTLLRRAAATDAERDADTEGYLWGVSFDPFTYLDSIDFGAPGLGTAHRRSDRQAPGADRGNQPNREEAMTTSQPHEGERFYLIVGDPDGRTYRISADDLSRCAMSADARERIEGYLVADDDTEGFAARVFGLGDWSAKPLLGRPLQSQGGTSISSAAGDAWDALSR